MKGVGGEVEGAEAPQILSSRCYVYKQLQQKDVQNIKTREGKKQLSAYKQCYKCVKA